MAIALRQDGDTLVLGQTRGGLRAALGFFLPLSLVGAVGLTTAMPPPAAPGAPDGFFVVFMALIGSAVVLAIAAPWTLEIHAELDRALGLFRYRSRGWFRRAVAVERPLGELVRVELRVSRVPRGIVVTVWGHFDAGPSLLLCRPYGSGPATLEPLVERMRGFLAPAEG